MKYKLLPKQKEFMEVPHNLQLDVVMYQGGYGSGKTWAGSLLGLMLARKYAGSRGLVGAKEYELVKNTTLQSYFEHLENMGYKKDRDFLYNKNDKKITLNNGSEILFKGLDAPEKFKSLNLHWAEIEEALQISDSAFKQLLARLRNTNKKLSWGDFRFRLFGHTNPQPNKGWIWKRFVENPKENYRLIIAPTFDNTFLPEHFIESMKEEYNPEYYRINVLGEFCNYSSGLVVKNFSSDNEKAIEYNKDLPLYLTCDFNVDPMC
ncbi:MAG: PBSX family phage terminase large subunit [Candidatus Gastranaerophilales bacterium]|nr:PBSX family phage terminase large subunit [Candidatus Gastranaerophilales bacterium]